MIKFSPASPCLFKVCKRIHCCILNTFPDMQVVRGAVQPEEEETNRLAVEVASILNVSVGGIFLYASLTTCIPAPGKGAKFKSGF